MGGEKVYFLKKKKKRGIRSLYCFNFFFQKIFCCWVRVEGGGREGGLSFKKKIWKREKKKKSCDLFSDIA